MLEQLHKIYICPRCLAAASLSLFRDDSGALIRCSACGLDSVEGEKNYIRYLIIKGSGLTENIYFCGIPEKCCVDQNAYINFVYENLGAGSIKSAQPDDC